MPGMVVIPENCQGAGLRADGCGRNGAHRVETGAVHVPINDTRLECVSALDPGEVVAILIGLRDAVAGAAGPGGGRGEWVGRVRRLEAEIVGTPFEVGRSFCPATPVGPACGSYSAKTMTRGRNTPTRTSFRRFGRQRAGEGHAVLRGFGGSQADRRAGKG